MRDAFVDRAIYPFDGHYMEVEGGRMHYLDEGEGPTIVFVHGTPTWSFLYRHLIRQLSPHYRCVAPDHLGFGLSDKPESADYRPEAHSCRLAELIDRLDLSDVTLVVHDFGGPIGLCYAVEHPDAVRRLVLFNSWMWSLRGNASTEKASRFLGGPIGKRLYRWLNFSPRVLIPALVGDKSRFPEEAHHHYRKAFPNAKSRTAPWVLARELIGSSDWYEGLWERRQAIAEKPALLLWGMEDSAFTPQHLERWKGLFPNAQIEEYAGAGHFVMEERDREIAPVVERFLAA